MTLRVFLGAMVALFAAAALLDVTGLAPGAGVGAIPFLLLLAAGFAVWRAVWPGQAAPTTTDLALPLDGALAARLDLTFGAGDITLAGDAPAGLLLAGTYAGAVSHRVSRTGEEAAITQRQPLSLVRRRADWRLSLSPAVTWAQIRLTLGASRATVDCTGLVVENLALEVGRTALDVVLPRRGAVSLQMSGGRVNLRVPAGVPAQVFNDVLLGQVIVDEGHFTADETRETFATPDFVAGPEALHLTLKGGLGTIEVTVARPPDKPAL